MEKEYRYYKNSKGKIVRLYIQDDECPLNPRTDFDGHIGKMMCWHREYSLGNYNENNYEDPDQFLSNLLHENVSEKSIINFVRNGKASNNIKLIYNKSSKKWELWSYYYYPFFQSSKEAKLQIYEENEDITWLVDDIIDCLSCKDKWYLLEKHANIIALPLYLYDHSGITMNCCGFSDRWDSGQVGWIYTDKNTVLGTGADIERNWKETAYKWMEGEVKEYDMYLQNEIYGIITEKYNGEGDPEDDDSWTDEESCWGFYSSKWGDDLIEEIANEYGISEQLFEKFENVA
jgi:hypothetical protein